MLRYLLALCAVTCLYGQSALRPEEAFADIFSSVLTGENPDGGQWSGAGAYLDAAGRRASPSPAEVRRILNKNIAQYRILIVPGFLSACAPSSRAFMEAEQHLKLAHRVDVQFIQVPDDTSRNNGSVIASYILHHANGGGKYIVVGHSKGAPDLQEALLDSYAAAHVAALVSVAGAVTGSPLAEASVGKGLSGLEVTLGCAGKLVSALQSLNGNERRVFLKEHPVPVVPSYSVVARADRAHTSQVLVLPWVLLGAGLLGDEDGLLMAAQGVLPGAKFLGTTLGDHVAVAHNFQGTPLAGLFTKNQFPRTTLLEALVRFVIEDLNAPQMAAK